jgi:hypothetical protein
MAIHKLRVVLAFGLHMGMGAFPLREVVSPSDARLVLDTWKCLGTCLGQLAAYPWLLRLGAIASRSALRFGHRPDLLQCPGQSGIWFRPA